MSHRYAITTATVVMLVVLRLNIGWHFFHEGMAHYADPQWTSAPTLRAAKGPLAPLYRSYLPDAHGMDQWLHAPCQKPQAAVDGFLGQLEADFDAVLPRFAAHYGLDEARQQRAAEVARAFKARARSWGASHADDLRGYAHQWQRRQQQAEAPAARDVPFQKQRLAESQATLAGQAAGWRGELAALDQQYHAALGGLLSDEQRVAGPLPRERTSIDAVDGVMTYVILAIGALLLLGLFTRTACLAGAAFLLSVVSMQPFWVSEALPTYNQFVEMFALLALATTHVGRWAGLDFFVYKLIFGSPRGDERQTDVSES